MHTLTELEKAFDTHLCYFIIASALPTHFLSTTTISFTQQQHVTHSAVLNCSAGQLHCSPEMQSELCLDCTTVISTGFEWLIYSPSVMTDMMYKGIQSV